MAIEPNLENVCLVALQTQAVPLAHRSLLLPCYTKCSSTKPYKYTYGAGRGWDHKVMALRSSCAKVVQGKMQCAKFWNGISRVCMLFDLMSQLPQS